MLRDVFYFGKKPNVHPREQFAESLIDAREKATTRDFWIINEFCDYMNFDWDFDFEFLPDEDVWAEDHNNVWPSQHQKDSGTWLCPKEHSDIIIYRGDVEPVYRKNIKNDNWVELDLIDHHKFDFSWHPDPTDPPYIYKWGCKFFPAQFKHVLEYRVPGATQEKYMDTIAELLPENDRWVEYQIVDRERFDMSWRPSPLDPPFVYVWGNKWVDGKSYPTLEYHAPGATDKKFMNELLPLKPDSSKFEFLEDVDKNKFDFTWRPDPTSPPYIYVWGNQWNCAEDKISVQYVVDGATEYKYMEERTVRKPCMDNWVIPEGIDVSDIDFSWEPSPHSPPYIYEFATQWQKTGGPQYIVPDATEKTYIDTFKATKLASLDNWTIPNNIDASKFDFSWHPDDTSPAYSYVFATQWAFSGGPVYTVEGATETKYVDDQISTATPDMTNWVYDATEIDVDSFDFSWHPYVEDQPYIYVFGTQWQKTGGPKYITPGADSSSPTKYIDTRILKSTRLSNSDDINWNILHPISDFDFSWHPDDTDEPYIYVFGNQWYSAEVMPSIEYRVPGATTVKYIHETSAMLAVDMTNWVVPDTIDTSGFDFSWLPEPEAPSYIHQFGTQWQKTGGPKYVMEGATEVNYNSIQKAKMLPSMDRWDIPTNIDISDFDFSWHPDDTFPAYNYVFATQWAFGGGPVYKVPGATEISYCDDQIALAKPDMTNWVYNETEIDIDSFDFSWHPYVEDQPYIYQFGTQWQKTGGPKYITPGADSSSPTKYIDTRVIKATRLPNRDRFNVLSGYKIKNFDFSWHPDDTAPAYVYVFGNNWYSAEECATLEYVVEGGEERTFIKDIVAKLDNDMTYWEVSSDIDVSRFDFSWIPHPAATPYIYQFGTTQDPNDGPRYITPNTNGEVIYVPRLEISEDEIEVVEEIKKYYIETTVEDLIEQHPDEIFWALSKSVDYTNFNFDWEPSIEQIQYVNVFGSSESVASQTYFVNSAWWHKGLKEFNYVEQQEKKTIQDLDIFYVDRGNVEAQARFDVLKAKFGNKIQKTRYLNSWVDTINRCTNRATSNLIWVLNSEIDYTDFDFSYYPNPWQMKMVHVFGTQWSHWGTTFMVNRETFPEDTKYIKIIEHLSNLNFVKENRAKATQCVHDIVVIDFNNIETQSVVNLLQSKAPTRTVSVVKYNESYLNSLKEIVRKQQQKKEHYLWICSSVCDYSDFDFSYICDPFAKDQLHVFPTGLQKFGDTFFLDVNQARDIIDELDKLDDYVKVNYNGSIKAKRLPEPTILVSDDTHVNAIKYVTDFPYYTLITQDNSDIKVPEIEPICLWAPETKNIQVTTTGATRIVVPSEVKDYVKKELYEYPYIKRSPKLTMSKPIDIVFLSNGETGADENYEHLLNVTKNLPNRVVRVDGVNGRVAAYHAAAEASETPWFFTVFAKLKVSPKFDWNWQPDRMQSPKHYIFHAKNPVNGLTYGHQAMIAYNKKLTLANEGRGLDFTLDDEHEVVPLISGTAQYNTDEFSTWRTAFREVIKLKADTNDVAKERLDAWLNKAQGDFAQYSIKGALDADEYYDEVAGDFDKLKLSYEWDWLRKKFEEM